MRPLLKVEGLKTYYTTQKGEVKAVDGVDFTLERGASLGIAGESGCGKTTLGYSLINLVPPQGRIVEGRIQLDNEDITVVSEEELRRRIRWKKVSMVFQGAMNCLNPFYTVDAQMVETVLTHAPEVRRGEAEDMSRRTLEMVDLGVDVLKLYPHELSGGMRQRVVIAMGLIMDPKVVIADEPTSALDVIVQARIINLLKDLQRRLKMSLILITHDLSIISEIADYVAVMYAGEFIEYGSLLDIYKDHKHPYTHRLLESIPRLMGKQVLKYIPGAPPDLRFPPPGCRFHPRCPHAFEKCKIEEPPRVKVAERHYVKCHRTAEELW